MNILGALAAAACLLLTAACSNGGADDQTGQQPVTVQVTMPATPGGTVTASQTPPSPGATTPQVSDLGSPVASRTTTTYKGAMKVEVHPPRRSNGTVLLHLSLSAVKAPAMIWYGLSDQDRSIADRENFAPDGIQLIDGKHKKAYLVAHDGAGHCFCTPRDLGEHHWQLGETILVSATFAEPPSTVTAVDIVIPTFGTFTNVQIG